MTKNEVVKILKYYISNISDVAECAKDVEAFEEAIRCVELVPLMEEYIELITKELESCVPIAIIHGWESDLFQQGALLRDKIEKAKGNSDE